MQVQPIRVATHFDPALLAALDAYRRAAPGLPSRAEVIREAVRVLASPKPIRKPRAKSRKPR